MRTPNIQHRTSNIEVKGKAHRGTSCRGCCVGVGRRGSGGFWSLGPPRPLGAFSDLIYATSCISSSSDTCPRKLGVIVLLSHTDEFEGGRLEVLFDADPYTPPMQRGTVVILPASLAHRVTPVTVGRRLSLIAMAHGPALR